MESNRIRLVKPDHNLIAGVTQALLQSKEELEVYFPWVQGALDSPESGMQTAIDNHEQYANELRYYICEQATSELVGCIGLIIRDKQVPFFEIGYWVKTSASGNGYISEALGLLESYAFTVLSARRVEIRMACDNTKSRAVAERAGYQLEAELACERRLPNGQLTNTLVFSKLAG